MPQLYLGDCLEVLKTIPDNSIDSCVTDPPYGWRFMGKKWDYDVPSIEIWREVHRVLKPGAHLLSFGGTRTYHRMVVAIEDAGFEIRDQIQWIFAQGFPKSLNLKEVAPGWGTALKPANEPIVVARKPLSEKTIAANVLKWGTGGLNIDGCRIGFTVETWPATRSYQRKEPSEKNKATQPTGPIPQGRFPSNVILDEEAGMMLDAQTKITSGSGARKTKSRNTMGFKGGETVYDDFSYPDSGGASRFFYCAKTSKRERNMGCDAMDAEKVNDGRQTEIDNPFQRGETLRLNTHPTIKPIALMRYLIRLVTPPGATVLDPFMGSGSTGMAAKQEGCEFVGIEKEPQYFEIAEKRIAV